MLTSFTATASASSAAHQYPQYIVVDGIEYDATQSPGGRTWELSYYEDQDCQLVLQNYFGGPIETNINVNMYLDKENCITGTAATGVGITVDGDLYVSSITRGKTAGTLSVTGYNGHAAISATGVLQCNAPMTAIGGGTAALAADAIRIDPHWPSVVSVGSSAEDSREGVYTNESYVSITSKAYTLTLNGNGGLTDNGGAESYDVVFTTGTPGHLYLYPYIDTFTNGTKTLLGWTEAPDGSGDFYTRTEEYTFPEDTYNAAVYAYWEDEHRKAVILENYGDSTFSSCWTRVVPCNSGMEYTLPESRKAGCIFNGWLAEDGLTTYQAGTKLTISDTLTLTAQYTPLKLLIDGQVYDASESHGSYEAGWHYYADNRNIQLNIYNNYSGKYIEAPSDVWINLHRSLTGETDKPAIHVDGNMYLTISMLKGKTEQSIKVIGSSGMSAISASGNVTIDVLSDELSLMLMGGSPETPAISAGKKIRIYEKLYYVGADLEHSMVAGKYSGEPYIYIEDTWNYSVELSGIATVPSVPENDVFIFVGWHDISTMDVWYRPGDVLDAGTSTTLDAYYLSDNGSTVAVLIDGNGAKTESGSKYHFSYVSSESLSMYRLPTAPFTYNGHSLKGYNTSANGSGTSYNAGGSINGDRILYNLYAQWQDNTSGGGGSGGGGSGGGSSGSSGGGGPSGNTNEPIINPDGSKTTTEADNETGSITITTSWPDGSQKIVETKKDGTVTTVATSKNGVKVESVTTSNGSTTAKVAIPKGIDRIEVTVPLTESTPGTVALLVKPDGTEEILKTSVITGDGIRFFVSGDAQIKIIDNSKTFVDVAEDSWAADAIRFVTSREIFSGTGKDAFSPMVDMSRAMLVTVLARLDGEDTTGGGNTWYSTAVDWAKTQGITDGTGLDSAITRESLAVMLYRYAGMPLAEGKEKSFADSGSVSSWATEAMNWAVRTGVIGGKSGNILDPQGTASRAEVAVMLMRFIAL